MRRILILGLGALCLLTFTASQASALVVAPEICESDADCPESFFCDLNCEDFSEEPSADVQCEGFCMPEQTEPQPDPKPHENDCEVDTDCPTGFECIEHEHASQVPTPVTTTEPGLPENPCPEDEECDESGSDEGAPTEDPAFPDEPEETEETEETFKTCAPKMCNTDADCGGDLLCVLETYECPSRLSPDKAPRSDCAEGEDCGEIPGEEEPKETEDPCEPETVGHCAPKWLAPCQVDVDCGPGFTCVEEEICWGTSGGSKGNSAGAPDEAPCDPDDENCGGDDAGDPDSSGSNPEEFEGEDEGMPSEGCESTGEFYCELQVIDCSTDACPEGMVCVSVPSAEHQDDCAVSSDGEMDCPESEEQPPQELCMPEGFEDWLGAGSGGQSYETSSETNEEGPADPEAPNDDDGSAASGSSSGSGDSGCAGGGTGAPLGTLALSLMILGLITRRRV